MLSQTVRVGMVRAATRFVPERVEDRVLRWADALRARGGVPIRLVLPSGRGVDLSPQPRVTVRINDPGLLAELTTPTLDLLGAAYVDGRLDVEGEIGEVVAAADALAEVGGVSATARAPLRPGRHQSAQDREDIQFHYDVGNAFYRLWLDDAMLYSCAYFRDASSTLEQAQRDKLDHICRKLRLTPGERLLDIGCGWGALVLHAARHYGVEAVGITLSVQQADLARQRVAYAGLQDRVNIELLDYRDLPARFGDACFDKVASVGMFEHVGLRNLGAYFGIVRRMLRERGLFLNHGITSSDVNHRQVGGGAGDFIDRYVFPHGELPHAHLALREMATQQFEVVDMESLRPHYALTLAHWSQRLESRQVEAAGLVGERRLRIWRIYLAGCSYAFQQGWINLYQMLGSKQVEPGLTRLPLTRDWIYARRART